MTFSGTLPVVFIFSKICWKSLMYGSPFYIIGLRWWSKNSETDSVGVLQLERIGLPGRLKSLLWIFCNRYNFPKLHAFFVLIYEVLHFLIKNVTSTVKFLKVFITWVNQMRSNLFIVIDFLINSTIPKLFFFLFYVTPPISHNNIRSFICFLNDYCSVFR